MYEKHIIVGNLGRDPEMKFTASTKAVTNINVAVNDVYYVGDGESRRKVERTTWYRVAGWGNTAEAMNKWLKKGSLVLVEYKNQKVSPYLNNDGEPAASIECTVQVIKFLKGTVNNGDGGADDMVYTQEEAKEETLKSELREMGF